MSLCDLLLRARPLLVQQFQDRPVSQAAGHPAFTLFFTLCDGETRARVFHACASDFAEAWLQGAALSQSEAKRHKLKVCWLRIDWVTAVEASTWAELKLRLDKIRRNYFRRGLALDAGLQHAFTEQELNANAMLYAGADVAPAKLNPKNFTAYAKRRYGERYTLDFSPDAAVYILNTEGLFLSDVAEHNGLPGSRTPKWLPGPGLDAGRRHTQQLNADHVYALVNSSAQFLARQVSKRGRFIYGHFPCFGREIQAYNALRHASTIYSMLEAWELLRQEPLLAAIRRSLAYLADTLIRRYPQPDGSILAYNVDGDEIKLGANAVSVLALVKYTELTGDQQYLPLMEQLALGMARMQDAEGGRFVHVLHAADLSLKNTFRIIYYDGEATFGLMRLYGLTKDPRWLEVVEKAFDYFLQADHWKAHDHWLSYCANELTRYKPDEKYFRFGVQNISGHLDFILGRETTYPTLLELSMAFEQMLGRIQQQPNMRHVLEGLDVDKFHRAMHHRANYLMNGFFWPEFAMYFAKPSSIVGSFFIRHHSFRVRIDDIEHYLSGYVAYWKYLQREQLVDDMKGVTEGVRTRSLIVSGHAATKKAVVVWGGDVNLGRRQHYRTAELGVENVLDIPALKSADLRIVNLECVVANSGEQGVPKGEGGPYYYRARPEMLRVLMAAGIDIVTTANNHSGDYGPEALLEQGRWLDSAGIGHAGSGATRDAALKPVIRRAGGLNIAVFALDSTMPIFAATSDRPGSAYLPIEHPQQWHEVLEPLITEARAIADVVLVAVHWGRNGATNPSKLEMAAGHALIDAGADAVLGASAHVLQGIEVYRDRPIIYDAGDLLFDSVRRSLGDSGLFRLELCSEGVKSISFVPVGTGFGYSVQRSGQEAILAAREYADQCAILGTALTVNQYGEGVIHFAPYRCEAVAPSGYRTEPLESARVEIDKPGCAVAKVPDDARITPMAFGPLTLLGVRIQPSKITQRQMLWVETFWTAKEPVNEDIRLDIQGVPVRPTTMPAWGKGMDHDPCDWLMPTTCWKPRVIYRDYFGLRPPYLKDWENVDLQLTVGVVAKTITMAPVGLPYFVKLAVPGKDRGNPIYRSEFPSIIYDCLPGQTWTAAQLAAVTGGTWLVPPPEGWFVTSVVSGGKHIGMRPGPVLYVAHDSLDRHRHEQNLPPTKNVDRHLFLAGLVPRLAGSIVSKIVSDLPEDFPLLLVPDPIQAIMELGMAARQRFTHDVVAITGTVGKSTVVGMLRHMLGDRVLATIDNYNSRVGVPSTLASLGRDYEAAIIEVAQSALWMRRGPVTRLLGPTIALITEVGMSQTQTAMIKSIEDVAKWKTRIFDGLEGAAVAIVGEHLACFDYVLAEAKRHAKRVIIFGHSEEAEVRIREISCSRDGSQVAVDTPVGSVHLHVPMLGEGMAHNAVAAMSVLYAMGRDIQLAAGALAQYRGEASCLQWLSLRTPGGAIDVIDDSWNAEVSSMLHAFAVVKGIPLPAHSRRIAVLGGIVHLGKMSKSLHENLAAPLLDAGFDLVVTHGDEIRHLRALLPEHTLGPHFSTAFELVQYLLSVARARDLVLLKGSRRDSDFGSIVSLMQRLAKESAAEY